MNGLPHEFKLFFNDKHVGYEEHFYNPDKKEIEIFHNNLKEVVGRILHPYNFYIKYDQKRQWTGFKDKNGDKIYFGDNLRDLNGVLKTFDKKIFIVKLLPTGIIMAVDEDEGYKQAAWTFSEMELIKEEKL